MTAIVLAADRNYLRYVVANLAQLSRFARGADRIYLIIPAATDVAVLSHITAAATSFDLRLHVTEVAGLSSLRDSGLLIDNGYISHFTYVKLLLAEALPELDEVLYLDIDTLVRAPIDDLLNWDLRHPIGAVEELGQNSRRIFGTSRESYFNAGVLRMSLRRVGQGQLWEQAQSILMSRPGLRFQDQDVLNLIFRGRFDILPGTYNVFDSLAAKNRDLWTMRDPAIVHFAGPIKPWHKKADSRFSREWRRQYTMGLRASGLGGVAPDYADPGEPEPIAGGIAVFGMALARKALPGPAKKAARSTALRVLDRALGRLDQAKTNLELGPYWRANLEVAVSTRERATGLEGLTGATLEEERGIDLLISMPNAGSDLLARAIQAADPGITSAAFDRTVLQMGHLSANGSRKLITVFPDHLDPGELEEVLRTLRPRLLILRRAMIFSFLSAPPQITYAKYGISESEVSDYVLKCDSWFDGAVHLAGLLQLSWCAFSYGGLFGSGSDVPLLRAVYPHASFRLNRQSGALLLQAGPDEGPGNDESLVQLVQTVTSLSTTTRLSLLRLPGTSAPFDPKLKRGSPGRH